MNAVHKVNSLRFSHNQTSFIDYLIETEAVDEDSNLFITNSRKVLSSAKTYDARNNSLILLYKSKALVENVDNESENLPGIAAPAWANVREEVIQEWEGRVVEILEDELVARLVDVTAGEGEETEEINLAMEDLADSDRSRVRVGSIFRWLIGYRFERSGTKERFARVVLRRLPAWNQIELTAAKNMSKMIVDEIAWD